MNGTIKRTVRHLRWTTGAVAALSTVVALLTAPAAQADPRGVFICLSNASDHPIRILWSINRGSSDPGPSSLAPGERRCAESTPTLGVILRPGEEAIGRQMAWRVWGQGNSVVITEGANADGLWVSWRTRANWQGIGVNDTRQVRVPALGGGTDGKWKFWLKRFANNENVGGGIDTSGNSWIRYLVTVKAVE